MTMRGVEPVAVGRRLYVPPLGWTDIDVLTGDGVWCESKRCPKGLFLTRDLAAKLHKMARARDDVLTIVIGDSAIPITRLILTNLGKVSGPVKTLADRLTIEVHTNSVYVQRPYC